MVLGDLKYVRNQNRMNNFDSSEFRNGREKMDGFLSSLYSSEIENRMQKDESGYSSSRSTPL